MFYDDFCNSNFFFALSVNAAKEVKETALSKIDSALTERLSELSDTDLVSVSVWFTDINYDTLKKRVEEELLATETRSAGVSQEAVDLVFYDTKGVNDPNLLSIENIKEAYGNVTTDEVKKVISAERAIASQMYTQNNQYIIDDIISDLSETTIGKTASLSIHNYDVQYVCRYAPNADMTLSKEAIYIIANNDNVVEINWRSPEKIEDEFNSSNSTNRALTYDDTFLDVAGLITARDAFGLSGEGISVGIIEAGGKVDTNELPTVENLNTNWKNC